MADYRSPMTGFPHTGWRCIPSFTRAVCSCPAPCARCPPAPRTHSRPRPSPRGRRSRHASRARPKAIARSVARRRGDSNVAGSVGAQGLCVPGRATSGIIHAADRYDHRAGARRAGCRRGRRIRSRRERRSLDRRRRRGSRNHHRRGRRRHVSGRRGRCADHRSGGNRSGPCPIWVSRTITIMRLIPIVLGARLHASGGGLTARLIARGGLLPARLVAVLLLLPARLVAVLLLLPARLVARLLLLPGPGALAAPPLRGLLAAAGLLSPLPSLKIPSPPWGRGCG